MLHPVSFVRPVTLPEPASLPVASSRPGQFQELLASAIQRVDSVRQDAAQSIQSLLAGESEELHTALLATQKAELAFELGLQLRNKVVQAYQEIMRMQM